MGNLAGTMLPGNLILNILAPWAWANNYLPSIGMTFDQMFYGVIYGKWLMFTEIILCGVVPAIMLITPSIRNNPTMLYTAAILDCIGVTLNRYLFTVQAIAIPVMPFDAWQTYAPNWAEWATSGMIVAYGFLVMSLSYRYLPVFPQERMLNK
jgi:molybdopterin-containing oxidoreductase family membrane subunit